MSNIFTPLESRAIHGGDNIIKTSIPQRKGGAKATSFLTGFILMLVFEAHPARGGMGGKLYNEGTSV
jgi:hypothetical protein